MACNARRLVALLALLAFSAQAQPAPAAPADPRAQRDLAIESSTLLKQLLNKPRPSAAAPSGAFGINARFERGEVPVWGLSYQRQGRNMIIHALATRSPAWINRGLKVFNWAFARQAADGGFPRSQSALYQLATFADAVARSCLLIEASRYAARYERQCDAYRPRIKRLAEYMRTPAVRERGERTSACCAHRPILVATAYAIISHFLDDRSYASDSRRYMRDALGRQAENGVIREKGGHDLSYQMVGIEVASHWLVYEHGRPLYNTVGTMVRKALAWARTRISGSKIKRAGDTRTRGQEVGPLDGRVKSVSHGSIVRAFAYWGTRVNSRSDRATAARIAAKYLPRSLPVVYADG